MPSLSHPIPVRHHARPRSGSSRESRVLSIKDRLPRISRSVSNPVLLPQSYPDSSWRECDSRVACQVRCGALQRALRRKPDHLSNSSLVHAQSLLAIRRYQVVLMAAVAMCHEDGDPWLVQIDDFCDDGSFDLLDRFDDLVDHDIWIEDLDEFAPG